MPWETLGLDHADADARAVKKAYARLLKKTRPDKDPDGFRQLREAYETALYQLELREKGVDLSDLVVPVIDAPTVSEAQAPHAPEPDTSARELSGPKPPPTQWTPVDDHPEVDPLDQVQDAWRNRDGIELRKALLNLIRAAIQDARYADPLNEALASTPHHILDIVLRQITPEEMIDELENESSTVAQGWSTYWLQRAQPDRLVALGEAWLKHQGRLVQSDVAIQVALYLAMALSLYRNALAHRLAEVAFPLVDARHAGQFDFLDALLIMGQHMKSAPQDEKTFWTQYFVLNLKFNWRSKKPQTHLWKLTRMPESETLIRLIAPRLPPEAFGEEAAPESEVEPEPKKKRHRRRKVKRNTYGGGHSNEQHEEEEASEPVPVRGKYIRIGVIGLLMLALLYGIWLLLDLVVGL